MSPRVVVIFTVDIVYVCCVTMLIQAARMPCVAMVATLCVMGANLLHKGNTFCSTIHTTAISFRLCQQKIVGNMGAQAERGMME